MKKQPKTFAKLIKFATPYKNLSDGFDDVLKTEDLKPADGKHFSLKELQGFVSGYIEIVPSVWPDLMIVCNEEGKLVSQWEETVNMVATVIYKYQGYDVIVGDVLLVHKSLLN